MKKMTKILFLDVDGVLNKRDDYEVIGDPDPYLRVNRKLLDNLHDIIRLTGCEIVLSSSWRRLDGGREFLEDSCKIPIKDTTIIDYLPVGKVRGDEIQLWLDENPEVISYCIVDDDSDMLPIQHEHFIQTEFDYGLNKRLTYRVIQKLGKKNE